MLITNPLAISIYRALNSANYGAKMILSPGGIFSGITYTQSGNLTYFDSTGTLQTAAVDTMVLDYNPSTLALRGYPFWEARTNVVLWNRDLTNAAWVKTSTTAAKTATGIDGVANSASTLTATGANGTCLQAITLGSSARFQTCWIKRRTGSGTINMTMDNGTTWTAVTVTASWTQVSIPTQTLANPTVGFRIVTSGDAIDLDYCQNENGTFATAVIATTTAAVTRAAPSCAITGSNFSSWFNAVAGTIVAAGTIADGTAATSPRIVAATSASPNNDEISIYWSKNITKVAGAIRSGGSSTFDQGTSTLTAAGATFKAATAYSSANANFSSGGAIGSDDTSITLPTCDRLSIGGAITFQPVFSGWISSLSYYAARLPNASLQSLTT